jgi:hypothetical protein
MDVRQVALAVSLGVFVVSALVYLLVIRHYRAALRRFVRRFGQGREQGRQQSVKLRIPDPPRAPTTVGHLSLIVAVLCLISFVVLGMLQLMRH